MSISVEERAAATSSPATRRSATVASARRACKPEEDGQRANVQREVLLEIETGRPRFTGEASLDVLTELGFDVDVVIHGRRMGPGQKNVNVADSMHG